ncbi:hypothetical protein [Phaeovulum sp.]|uniref:hypothetical protein n=1 Tax=Phaeovulum sp. TaxID=2934796 RepID=UPI0039E40E5F
MKRIALGLILATLTALPTLAGGFSMDLPRLDFPTQGAQVTRDCATLLQPASCND